MSAKRLEDNKRSACDNSHIAEDILLGILKTIERVEMLLIGVTSEI